MAREAQRIVPARLPTGRAWLGPRPGRTGLDGWPSIETPHTSQEPMPLGVAGQLTVRPILRLAGRWLDLNIKQNEQLVGVLDTCFHGLTAQ